MASIVKFDRFFIFSEANSLAFNANIIDGVNIIHGRNTSGKSTFFQSIIHTLGVNEYKELLKPVLDQKVVFRLDLRIINNSTITKYIFIREDETLIVKADDTPTQVFHGISANNSAEHIKLKEFVHEVFGYHLNLEYKDGYKSAPIEVMLLPFYVSQTVGWVYLRRSFSSLEFFKNFKDDYLDYFLGLESTTDRARKKHLELTLREKNEEIDFLTKAERNNDDFQISKIIDEDFGQRSIEYIEKYSSDQKTLIDSEGEYVEKCNELALLKERLSILRKVARHQIEQMPETGICPTCSQNLPTDIRTLYRHFQEENDTQKEVLSYKQKIKDVQARINSLSTAIEGKSNDITDGYRVISKYFNVNITFDKWLSSKANIKLIENITQRIGSLTIQKKGIEDELSGLKSTKDLVALRLQNNSEFYEVFKKYMDALSVLEITDPRFTQLYSISVFPSQGVELHKTVLAYHFAFNLLIKKTPYVARFPFMLDAIFKEDVESGNKELIVNFISKHRPKDTQLMFSVAEKQGDALTSAYYNRKYFKDQANLITIANGVDIRSILLPHNNEYSEFAKETLNLIENTK